MTAKRGQIEKVRQGARLWLKAVIEGRAMVTRATTSQTARSALTIGLWLMLLALSGTWTACKKRADALPKLGEVGAFSLLNQNAAPVSAQTLRGKVWVAAFFFTHCPTICPRITRRMRALQVAAAAKAPALELVSFSVDPENDTPPVLLAYARRFDADVKNWSFLTGDLAVVKRTVVDGFKLALDGKPDPTAENGGIIHGSHLVLVDRTLAIRGYYRTDDEDDMTRLLQDAARL
jgi:protein SCO1/2